MSPSSLRSPSTDATEAPSQECPGEISSSSSAFKDEDDDGDGDGGGAAPKPRWRKENILELLKAIAAFRYRNGVPPRLRFMADFLEEVKDLVPKGLTKEQLCNKMISIRSDFRRSPTPGPNSSDYQKRFHELVIKAWGAEWFESKAKADARAGKSKRSAAAAANQRRRAAKKAEEEMGHANSEQSEDEEPDGRTGESMKLDGDKPDYPFPFLKRALQELWIEKKLDLNLLQVALQKLDPVKAKHLDDQFLEIAKDELKFEIERNELMNEIIKVIGAQLRGVRKKDTGTRQP